MQLRIIDDLPFSTVTISYHGMEVVIPNVLVDTGSATSIFNADQLGKINLTPNPDDILFTIRGVGGTEVVFSRRVDSIQLGDKKIPDFQIEIGGMDYGFDILGILGMDFLMQSEAVIDLKKKEISFQADS